MDLSSRGILSESPACATSSSITETAFLCVESPAIWPRVSRDAGKNTRWNPWSSRCITKNSRRHDFLSLCIFDVDGNCATRQFTIYCRGYQNTSCAERLDESSDYTTVGHDHPGRATWPLRELSVFVCVCLNNAGCTGVHYC